MSKSDDKNTMLTIRIDPALKDWVRWYANHNSMSVTQLIIGYLRDLKGHYEREERDDDVPQI